MAGPHHGQKQISHPHTLDQCSTIYYQNLKSNITNLKKIKLYLTSSLYYTSKNEFIEHLFCKTFKQKVNRLRKWKKTDHSSVEGLDKDTGSKYGA